MSSGVWSYAGSQRDGGELRSRTAGHRAPAQVQPVELAGRSAPRAGQSRKLARTSAQPTGYDRLTNVWCCEASAPWRRPKLASRDV
jgi:hypothetical protein